MLPPIQIEARRVVGTLDGNDASKPVGSAEGQLQGDITAE
jgi:hypothetical protein